MTEDVGSYVRLSYTVCLLSALVACTLNLTIVGQQFAQGWLVDFESKVHNSSNVLLGDIVRQHSVSAALAYRYISTVDSPALESFEIILLDGTTLYDYRYLLENAEKQVSVSVDGRIGERYSITVREVN